ncbi:uncharacterized protein [Clytia hemisphaerica]|uniref:uncharacterized protein isoform X2 n=1 Tax=Clytia hemisphaerica TaxID=252671 RepID=UPI0034D5B6D5
MPIVLTPKWLLDLLNSKATYLQYHAFQKGIRHNHKLEGAVAIARLGGSKEYVEKYFDVIDKRYLKYTGLEDDETQLLERDFLQSDKLEDYRGKNQAYYKMLSMYTKLYETKYDKNIKKMIQGVCPDILDGPLHSSFHGAIQLAYGLVCGCDQAVLEGITFMDQQYSPVFPNDTNDEKRKDLTGFGHGKKDIFELLNDLASNTTLKEKIKLDHQKGFEFRKQNHMYGAYGWSALQYHSEYFFELTNSIALPEWFVVEDKDMTQGVGLTVKLQTSEWISMSHSSQYVQCFLGYW